VSLAAALEASPTAERAKVDREAGALVGSRCRNCATVSFPARAVCHRCGAAGLEVIAISQVGSLISFTRCWVPRPGLEPPFTIGQVKFPEGVTVFGHVRGLPEGVRVPTPVRVVLAEGEDAVPAFWFAHGGGADA
jgi:uncharacterized OB-fold protein